MVSPRFTGSVRSVCMNIFVITFDMRFTECHIIVCCPKGGIGLPSSVHPSVHPFDLNNFKSFGQILIHTSSRSYPHIICPDS